MTTEATNKPAERPESALPSPRRHGDTDWHARIAKAKEARAATKEIRKGKPATFATHQAARWTGA